MSFTVIDVIFIIIILIFAVVATVKGFVKELFNKASFIFGIIFGCMFCNKLKVYISETVTNDFFALIISFLLIFVVVFLVIQIVKIIVGKFFENEIMSGLNRAFGFFFGVIEGLAIVLLIIMLISSLPFNSENLFQNSFFYNLLSPLLFMPKQLIHKEAA